MVRHWGPRHGGPTTPADSSGAGCCKRGSSSRYSRSSWRAPRRAGGGSSSRSTDPQAPAHVPLTPTPGRPWSDLDGTPERPGPRDRRVGARFSSTPTLCPSTHPRRGRGRGTGLGPRSRVCSLYDRTLHGDTRLPSVCRYNIGRPSGGDWNPQCRLVRPVTSTSPRHPGWDHRGTGGVGATGRLDLPERRVPLTGEGAFLSGREPVVHSGPGPVWPVTPRDPADPDWAHRRRVGARTVS